ncbi:tyrosine-protein kinase STYK1 isoform X1 [Hemibagrus wyckioides]|uniref:tyrosine-protein kinase STYK1 isoform X1 n=2 Tax=Hemibagrus wyckioides TaxID=337641 RepID=UPI00266CE70B|nr:tyrosine-protein kinase STYK1 isoform X1 [Hemibagrus wyckioides]
MSNSTNTTSQCEDRLCIIVKHQVELIVIPVLLLGASLCVLISICFLMLCHKTEITEHKYQKQRYSKKRQHLQGIDAPPELNPLDHEVVPMTVQTQKHKPNRQPADPQSSTERQHCSFEHVTPMSLSFTLKPDKTVTLYQATMDQNPVVLRVLNESADSRERQVFLGFAHFLSYLGPHPYLPRLLGVIRDKEPMFMILEGLENRDLLGFLWRCRAGNAGLEAPCAITEKVLFSMARQIASALEHLHSKDCIHGNIGARSVLVGQDLSVRLWGLGPAFRRRINVGTSGEVKEIEMRKWQAPEVLAHRTVSQSSDVWSFGILLHEMVTLGEPPFPKVMTSELVQYLQRGKSIKRPSNCSNSLYNIIKACCKWKPEDRASLKEVISMLQLAESRASDTMTLQAPEPLDIEKYMQEAGYAETYNFAVL